MKAFYLSLVVMVAGFGGKLQAQVVLTYAETPGAVLSSLANTSVMTFEGITSNATSTFTNGKIYTDLDWNGVGTYDSIAVRTADQYGGVNDTGHYAVQSTSASLGQITTTTLTLNTPSAYFGLWWSAGDSKNVLKFYSGANATGNLVASFTTATLLSMLPSTYLGNPFIAGADPAEKFAFLNFYAEPGSTWQSIVFTNDGNSGFESDNHTSRVEGWGEDANDSGTLPGDFVEVVSGTSVSTLPTSFVLTAVPEPGTGAMLIGGAASLTFLLRRKRQAARGR